MQEIVLKIELRQFHSHIGSFQQITGKVNVTLLED